MFDLIDHAHCWQFTIRAGIVLRKRSRKINASNIIEAIIRKSHTTKTKQVLHDDDNDYYKYDDYYYEDGYHDYSKNEDDDYNQYDNDDEQAHHITFEFSGNFLLLALFNMSVVFTIIPLLEIYNTSSLGLCISIAIICVYWFH